MQRESHQSRLKIREMHDESLKKKRSWSEISASMTLVLAMISWIWYQSAQTIKVKIEKLKLYQAKRETSTQPRKQSTECKGNPHNVRKHLQITYLIQSYS